METVYDFLVVGLGAFGSSSLLELKKHGFHVLGIDQSFPGKRGSLSFGETRIFRQAYFEDESFIEMTFEAKLAWDKLELESGVQLAQKIGHTVNYEEGDQGLEELESLCLEYNIPFYKRNNSLSEINAFTIDVNRYFQMMLEKIGKEQYVIGEKVLSITDGDVLEITTNLNTYRARNIVISAGQWSENMLKGIVQFKREVVCQRSPVMWFKNTIGLKQSQSFKQDDNHFYLIPNIAQDEFKIFNYNFNFEYKNPSDHSFDLTTIDKAKTMNFLSEKFEITENDIKSEYACLYYSTPDDHFYLDKLGIHSNIIVATGGSGHAFKFAPILGKRVLDLI